MQPIRAPPLHGLLTFAHLKRQRSILCCRAAHNEHGARSEPTLRGACDTLPVRQTDSRTTRRGNCAFAPGLILMDAPQRGQNKCF